MDFDLLYDAQIMKAQCLWRSDQPLEAVKNFRIAQRYKDREGNGKKGPKFTTAQL